VPTDGLLTHKDKDNFPISDQTGMCALLGAVGPQQESEFTYINISKDRMMRFDGGGGVVHACEEEQRLDL
jgi:hypothetical protein